MSLKHCTLNMSTLIHILSSLVKSSPATIFPTGDSISIYPVVQFKILNHVASKHQMEQVILL